MLKECALAICTAFLSWASCQAAEHADGATPPAITYFPTPAATQVPSFDSLRIRGVYLALPGANDTIDRDFAGIRSSLAALGIGYIGYSNNTFFDNMLSTERKTFGQQTYNGQKPTFVTNNVMQVTYDLARYGIPDGQIVLGGIYIHDTWKPAGPNALSVATFSYYQTLLNKQVELKLGYLNNSIEFWGPFLAGNLASSIFGINATIPVEAGISAYARTAPGIDIKFNGPGGLYNKVGVQRASSPDGALAEKTANSTGLRWSIPNSGVLVMDELGFRQEAAPGQLASWVRAALMYNTSRYTDFEFGGRRTGDYAVYFLADRQLVQLETRIPNQAARGVYAGVAAMYTPPEVNRFSQYYELRLYGIGLFPWRPRDMLAFVVSRNVFSHELVDTARQQGRLAHASSLSMTAAYNAPIAPGIQVGIGLGYTDHPTPIIYTPKTGSALNLLANVTLFW